MPKKIQRKVQPKARPVELAAAPGAAPGRNGRAFFSSKKVSSKALVGFTSQLATLLDAGLPIVRCLRILEGQLPPGPLKRVLIQTTEEVEGGSSLSDALAKHPSAFSSLYTNMVRAGVASERSRRGSRHDQRRFQLGRAAEGTGAARAVSRPCPHCFHVPPTARFPPFPVATE